MKLRKYAAAFAAAAALTVIRTGKRKNAAKRAGLLAVTLLGTSALLLGTGTAALASPSSEVCAQAGLGYCLNDWGGGGSGTAVKMYNQGAQNNNFQTNTVNACDGGDIIQADCTAAWGGSWSQGAQIVEVKYLNNTSLCVATSGGGYTVMGACGDSTGSGAANGVIMATFCIQNCCQTGEYGLVDRYWSHANGFKVWLLSGGAVGNQALFSSTGNSCWGRINN